MKPISDYLKECSNDWVEEVAGLIDYCAKLEHAIVDARDASDILTLHNKLHSIKELEK